MEILTIAWMDTEKQAQKILDSSFVQLLEATAWLDQKIKEDKTVMVHCVQGISRSNAVVIAYLVQYREMPLEEARVLVKNQHATSDPVRFMAMLIGFEQFIQKRREEGQ